ncbi:MAG: hypothetical protein Q9M89_04140 [Persephonella sp.]|nr:hypothetical protein [Persephonella sp.]
MAFGLKDKNGNAYEVVGVLKQPPGYQYRNPETYKVIGEKMESQ